MAMMIKMMMMTIGRTITTEFAKNAPAVIPPALLFDENLVGRYANARILLYAGKKIMYNETSE